jgi:hypothetical protein
MRRRTLGMAVIGTAGLIVVLVGAQTAALLPTPRRGSASGTPGTSTFALIGGGHWETVWNNALGEGPSSVWVNQSGYYYADYNDSSGAAGSPGWSSLGAPTTGTNGTTVVNMTLTNQTATAEAMMCYLAVGTTAPLPWHFDSATGLFVRDP